MITLIGKEIAKKGTSFIFQGAAEECETCRYKSTCVNSLEVGRKYTITEVKNSEHRCPIHGEGKVTPIEVELADIEMLFDSKKVFEGSHFNYEEPECSIKDCKYRYLCFPEGLVPGDKVMIAKDLRESPENCEMDKSLKKILARF
jgi:uncharacterized protein (UPF0179 family)